MWWSKMCSWVCDGYVTKAEKEKLDVWRKAKMIASHNFMSKVQSWVSSVDQCVLVDDAGIHLDNGIRTEVSVSYVVSKGFGKSSASGRSGPTSWRVKAEPEKAALLAQMAALKKKHALEEQEQRIRPAEKAPPALIVNETRRWEESGCWCVSSGELIHCLRLLTTPCHIRCYKCAPTQHLNCVFGGWAERRPGQESMAGPQPRWTRRCSLTLQLLTNASDVSSSHCSSSACHCLFGVFLRGWVGETFKEKIKWNLIIWKYKFSVKSAAECLPSSIMDG